MTALQAQAGVSLPELPKYRVVCAQRLREVLSYDSESGLFHWKARRKGVKAGKEAGADHGDGYIRIMLDGRSLCAHRLAWVYVYGTEPVGQVDHINGVRHDNRIANLREASHAENLANGKMRALNTSGFRGVTLFKGTKKWRAMASVSGKNRHLGLFDTPEEAAAAYDEFILANRGEFARLNFSRKQGIQS